MFEFNPYATLWYNGVLNLDIDMIPLTVVMTPLMSNKLQWPTNTITKFLAEMDEDEYIKPFNIKTSSNVRYIPLDNVSDFLHKVLDKERLPNEFIHPVELHFRSLLYAWKRYTNHIDNNDPKTFLDFNLDGFENCTAMQNYEILVSSLAYIDDEEYPRIDLDKFIPLALKNVRAFSRIVSADNKLHILTQNDMEKIKTLRGKVDPSFAILNSDSEIQDIFMPIILGKVTNPTVEFTHRLWSIMLPDTEVIRIRIRNETYVVDQHKNLATVPDLSDIPILERSIHHYITLDDFHSLCRRIHFDSYSHILYNAQRNFKRKIKQRN